jgi:hypothetical protein
MDQLHIVKAMVSELAPVVREYVSREILPIIARLDIIEAKQPERGERGEPGPAGEPGKDGLGFDDIEIVHNGEREFAFRLCRGNDVKEFAFSVPAMIYRGIYRESTNYMRGDVVTWSGSAWHCSADTSDKPGDGSTSWTLAVKEGRKGKDGKDGDPGTEGKPGAPGRDGRTWQ